MRQAAAARLAPSVRRSLTKLGRDLRAARIRRRLTARMMAERVGVALETYRRVERGDPGTGIATYASVLFVLGFGTPLAKLADVAHDQQGRMLDDARLPQRVRARREAKPL